MGFLGKAREAMETARGQVDFDLQEWAAAHGLAFVNDVPIMGIAFARRHDRLSNTCFGELPGGERGAVAHEFAASSNSSGRTLQQTRVAVRVPEAVAPLRRFAITNSSELREIRLGPTHQQIDPVGLGLGQNPGALGAAAGMLGHGSGVRWTMIGANPIDADVLAGLLSGAMGTILEAYPGPFELRYEFGTLTLIRDRAYLGGAELDSHCEAVCAVAQAIRQACLAAAHPQPFETELAPPAWLDEPPPQGPTTRKVAGITMVTGTDRVASESTAGFDLPLPEPWRGSVVALAGGAALEDPLAYHAAFPSNPVPGHAFAVIRQAEGGTTGRIALHTEGALRTGACAVLIRVNASAQNHRAPITAEAGALSVGVNDGIMAAWMYRDDGVSADQTALIASEATNLATKQGWLPL